MLGLVLAMLYVAYQTVLNNAVVEEAVVGSMGFLWYWHVVFACFGAGLVLLVGLVGAGATVFADTSEGKAMGVGGILLSPILLVVAGISSALFLGGVYCVNAAAHSPAGEVLQFADWNMSVFVIGCILYGLGVLKQMATKLSTSSSKD